MVVLKWTDLIKSTLLLNGGNAKIERIIKYETSNKRCSHNLNGNRQRKKKITK